MNNRLGDVLTTLLKDIVLAVLAYREFGVMGVGLVLACYGAGYLVNLICKKRSG